MDSEIEDIKKDLERVKKEVGLSDKKGGRVEVIHYYLFGSRVFKILSRVRTIGDRDEWVK